MSKLFRYLNINVVYTLSQKTKFSLIFYCDTFLELIGVNLKDNISNKYLSRRINMYTVCYPHCILVLSLQQKIC